MKVDERSSETFSCHCGAVTGKVKAPPYMKIRSICTCEECRNFMSFVGAKSSIEKASIGTDTIHMDTASFNLETGVDQLVRFRSKKNKKAERFYAKCCKAPIFSVSVDKRLTFLGLFPSRLNMTPNALLKTFGPVRFWIGRKGQKNFSSERLGWQIALTIAYIKMFKRVDDATGDVEAAFSKLSFEVSDSEL